LKHSKGAIYSLHRKEFAAANKHIETASSVISNLLPRVVSNPALRLVTEHFTIFFFHFALSRYRDSRAQHSAQHHTRTYDSDMDCSSGGFSSSLEEFTEAVAFKKFLESGTLLAPTDIPFVDYTEYLGGVIDFTGELCRLAVLRATVRDVASVVAIRDMIEFIFGETSKFDFRNGSKYNSLVSWSVGWFVLSLC
jgi:predicted translin family RNA/ssDNA-binding protein